MSLTQFRLGIVVGIMHYDITQRQMLLFPSLLVSPLAHHYTHSRNWFISLLALGPHNAEVKGILIVLHINEMD